MDRLRGIVIALLVVAFVGGTAAQSGPDRDASWNAFISWLKAAPATRNPLADYAGKLQRDGKAEGDVRKELTLVTDLLAERSDWIGIYFDKVYARPLTGDPATDGFSAQPSAFLVDSIKGLEPGTALDVGMGQGRNAVFLARQGWKVTGFDISEGALVASQANAQKAGVRLSTVKASYDSFDFGADRWDLIVLAFAWAPVTDPAFVARLRTSLRPGGRVIVEHFVLAAGGPAPNVARALEPNQLRKSFNTFQIASYDEVDGVGDWGGPGSRLVRMVAVKTPADTIANQATGRKHDTHVAKAW